jgi:oligopeptidase B
MSGVQYFVYRRTSKQNSRIIYSSLVTPHIHLMCGFGDRSLCGHIDRFDGWSDPCHDKILHDVIAGYSPVDNVRRVEYPPMYVTTGVVDSRVPFYGLRSCDI